mgnify:CR=1 FL=1
MVWHQIIYFKYVYLTYIFLFKFWSFEIDQDNGDWEVPPGVKRFTYKEIMKATKSFNKDCEIGEGGFGKVYLAQLYDNQIVAIKRASGVSFQGIKEFWNEIMLLSRLHHRHLVGLKDFVMIKMSRYTLIIVYDASRILLIYILLIYILLVNLACRFSHCTRPRMCLRRLHYCP